MNNDVCDDWKNNPENLTISYKPEDIINANETGLSSKCKTSDKTFAFKDDDCHGGKHSKERVTLMLAVNATGTEKFKPFVIGKYTKPRCFKGIKSLPVEYTSNKKAWMTASLFRSWLLNIDKNETAKPKSSFFH